MIGEEQHLQQDPGGGGWQHTQAGHIGLLTSTSAYLNPIIEQKNSQKKQSTMFIDVYVSFNYLCTHWNEQQRLLGFQELKVK